MLPFKALHDLAHRYLSNLLDEERSDYNLRLPNQILFGINDKDRHKFEWNVSKVDVGSKHMAQSDYEGAELSLNAGEFSTGKSKQHKDKLFILSIVQSSFYPLYTQ